MLLCYSVVVDADVATYVSYCRLLWLMSKYENKEENDKERRLEEVQKTKGQMEGRIVGAKFVKERTLVGEGQI